MQRHIVAHREFPCRLVRRTASASSGFGICAVSSAQRVRTVEVLALHCPLLQSAFSQPGTTDQSRRLRWLNETRAEERKEQPVSLGGAPEGAFILRPFALRHSCKVRRVTQGREKTSPLFSSAGALSLASGASSSASCSACLQPPWPNHSVKGTAGKHSLPVPRGLRPRAAPYLKR